MRRKYIIASKTVSLSVQNKKGILHDLRRDTPTVHDRVCIKRTGQHQTPLAVNNPQKYMYVVLLHIIVFEYKVACRGGHGG